MQEKQNDDAQVVQPLRIINVIEGRWVVDRPSKNQLRSEYRRSLQLQQQIVSQESLASRSVNMVDALNSFSGTMSISFDDGEIMKVQSSHFDPLVISVWICNSQVRRVLIDGGSGVDVIFLDTFKKIGLSESLIQRNVDPLVGFDGRSSYPVGNIVLPVTAAKKLLHVEFTIVDAMSAYNVKLGRGWIHRMEGVASTFHQVFKCRAVDGKRVAVIRGDQPTAK